MTSLTAQDAEGATPLMLACKDQDVAKVDQLLSKNVPLTTQDNTGKTALHYCVENDMPEIAEKLLGANRSLLEIKDNEGYTALQLSTIAGNRPMIESLLNVDADIMTRDNEGHTPAHWATVCGHASLLDYLEQNGADLSVEDVHGARPIHYAAQMCGASSDTDRKTGLNMLQKLISKGMDVGVEDNDKRSPLMWAASAGSPAGIETLVNAGASVDSADKDGLTALHCCASKGYASCVDVLKRKGANLDSMDKNGCTPMFYSVTLGHMNCTKELMSGGADANHRDSRGRTPAHCAAAKGALDAVKLLQKNSADVWQKSNRGEYPIHEASLAKQTDTVEHLLVKNEDKVNVANNEGRTCLHIAALTNNLALCKKLVARGAKLNHKMKGRDAEITPYDAAKLKRYDETAEFLKIHGAKPAKEVLDEEEPKVQETIPETAREEQEEDKPEEKETEEPKEDEKPVEEPKEDQPEVKEEDTKEEVEKVEEKEPAAEEQTEQKEEQEQSTPEETKPEEKVEEMPEEKPAAEQQQEAAQEPERVQEEQKAEEVAAKEQEPAAAEVQEKQEVEQVKEEKAEQRPDEAPKETEEKHEPSVAPAVVAAGAVASPKQKDKKKGKKAKDKEEPKEQQEEIKQEETPAEPKENQSADPVVEKQEKPAESKENQSTEPVEEKQVEGQAVEKKEAEVPDNAVGAAAVAGAAVVEEKQKDTKEEAQEPEVSAQQQPEVENEKKPIGEKTEEEKTQEAPRGAEMKDSPEEVKNETAPENEQGEPNVNVDPTIVAAGAVVTETGPKSPKTEKKKTEVKDKKQEPPQSPKVEKKEDPKSPKSKKKQAPEESKPPKTPKDGEKKKEKIQTNEAIKDPAKKKKASTEKPEKETEKQKLEKAVKPEKAVAVGAAAAAAKTKKDSDKKLKEDPSKKERKKEDWDYDAPDADHKVDTWNEGYTGPQDKDNKKGPGYKKPEGKSKIDTGGQSHREPKSKEGADNTTKKKKKGSEEPSQDAAEKDPNKKKGDKKDQGTQEKKKGEKGESEKKEKKEKTDKQKSKEGEESRVTSPRENANVMAGAAGLAAGAGMEKKEKKKKAVAEKEAGDKEKDPSGDKSKKGDANKDLEKDGSHADQAKESPKKKKKSQDEALVEDTPKKKKEKKVKSEAPTEEETAKKEKKETKSKDKEAKSKDENIATARKEEEGKVGADETKDTPKKKKKAEKEEASGEDTKKQKRSEKEDLSNNEKVDAKGQDGKGESRTKTSDEPKSSDTQKQEGLEDNGALSQDRLQDDNTNVNAALAAGAVVASSEKEDKKLKASPGEQEDGKKKSKGKEKTEKDGLNAKDGKTTKIAKDEADKVNQPHKDEEGKVGADETKDTPKKKKKAEKEEAPGEDTNKQKRSEKEDLSNNEKVDAKGQDGKGESSTKTSDEPKSSDAQKQEGLEDNGALSQDRLQDDNANVNAALAAGAVVASENEDKKLKASPSEQQDGKRKSKGKEKTDKDGLDEQQDGKRKSKGKEKTDKDGLDEQQDGKRKSKGKEKTDKDGLDAKDKKPEVKAKDVAENVNQPEGDEKPKTSKKSSDKESSKENNQAKKSKKEKTSDEDSKGGASEKGKKEKEADSKEKGKGDTETKGENEATDTNTTNVEAAALLAAGAQVEKNKKSESKKEKKKDSSHDEKPDGEKKQGIEEETVEGAQKRKDKKTKKDKSDAADVSQRRAQDEEVPAEQQPEESPTKKKKKSKKAQDTENESEESKGTASEVEKHVEGEEVKESSKKKKKSTTEKDDVDQEVKVSSTEAAAAVVGSTEESPKKKKKKKKADTSEADTPADSTDVERTQDSQDEGQQPTLPEHENQVNNVDVGVDHASASKKEATDTAGIEAAAGSEQPLEANKPAKSQGKAADLQDAKMEDVEATNITDASQGAGGDSEEAVISDGTQGQPGDASSGPNAGEDDNRTRDLAIAVGAGAAAGAMGTAAAAAALSKDGKKKKDSSKGTSVEEAPSAGDKDKSNADGRATTRDVMEPDSGDSSLKAPGRQEPSAADLGADPNLAVNSAALAAAGAPGADVAKDGPAKASEGQTPELADSSQRKDPKNDTATEGKAAASKDSKVDGAKDADGEGTSRKTPAKKAESKAKKEPTLIEMAAMQKKKPAGVEPQKETKTKTKKKKPERPIIPMGQIPMPSSLSETTNITDKDTKKTDKAAKSERNSRAEDGRAQAAQALAKRRKKMKDPIVDSDDELQPLVKPLGKKKTEELMRAQDEEDVANIVLPPSTGDRRGKKPSLQDRVDKILLSPAQQREKQRRQKGRNSQLDDTDTEDRATRETSRDRRVPRNRLRLTDDAMEYDARAKVDTWNRQSRRRGWDSNDEQDMLRISGIGKSDSGPPTNRSDAGTRGPTPAGPPERWAEKAPKKRREKPKVVPDIDPRPLTMASGNPRQEIAAAALKKNKKAKEARPKSVMDTSRREPGEADEEWEDNRPIKRKRELPRIERRTLKNEIQELVRIFEAKTTALTGINKSRKLTLYHSYRGGMAEKKLVDHLKLDYNTQQRVKTRGDFDNVQDWERYLAEIVAQAEADERALRTGRQTMAEPSAPPHSQDGSLNVSADWYTHGCTQPNLGAIWRRYKAAMEDPDRRGKWDEDSLDSTPRFNPLQSRESLNSFWTQSTRREKGATKLGPVRDGRRHREVERHGKLTSAYGPVLPPELARLTAERSSTSITAASKSPGKQKLDLSWRRDMDSSVTPSGTLPYLDSDHSLQYTSRKSKSYSENTPTGKAAQKPAYNVSRPNRQHTLRLDTSGIRPTHGSFNWQSAVAAARERSPAAVYNADKQRRSEWQELRNRQLHRAYVTPVVPGDWTNLVKTHETIHEVSSTLEDEARDALTTLSVINEQLHAQAEQLTGSHYRLLPPGGGTGGLANAVSRNERASRATAAGDGHGGTGGSTERPPWIPEENYFRHVYGKPAAWAQSATDGNHRHQHHLSLSSIAASSTQSLATSVRTGGSNSLVAPRKTWTSRRTGAPRKLDAPRRTESLRLAGQQITAPNMPDTSPNETKGNNWGKQTKNVDTPTPEKEGNILDVQPSKGDEPSGLRPKSRTSLNSTTLSGVSGDAQRHSTPKIGLRLLPHLDRSKPLIHQRQHTPADDGWETDHEYSVGSDYSSVTVRQRLRRRKSSRQRSRRRHAERRGQSIADSENPTEVAVSVSVDDTESNAERIHQRERERRMRHYAPYRATSALPGPEQQEEVTPMTSRTGMTMSSMEIDLPSSVSNIESPLKVESTIDVHTPPTEDLNPAQAPSEGRGRTTLQLSSSLMDSPEWEDEEERTASRGTSRDAFRNLDPLSKRRLDAKKSKLYKKLQANIVKKRYDKNH